MVEGEEHSEAVEWISYVDAATLAGRSVTWVRNAANRGLVRRRADARPHGATWVARADVEQLAAERRAGADRRMQRTVPPAPPGAVTLVDTARALEVSYNGVRQMLLQGRLRVHTRRHPYTFIDEASVQDVLAAMYDGRDPAELMTYTEAAAQLGVTIQAVRRLVNAGTLTTVGRSRRARVLRAEVETVKKRRATPP